MKILSLDMATVTGWATNVHGNRSGTVEFPVKRGESPGRGWDPADDNEADAALLLEYGLNELRGTRN